MRLMGYIGWETEAAGYCRCLGEAMHTPAPAKRITGRSRMACRLCGVSSYWGGGGGEPVAAALFRSWSSCIWRVRSFHYALPGFGGRGYCWQWTLMGEHETALDNPYGLGGADCGWRLAAVKRTEPGAEGAG